MTPINKLLNAYTPGDWTDLVQTTTAATVLKSLAIKVGANVAAVSIQFIDSSGTSLMLLVDAQSLPAALSYTLDLEAITMAVGQKLQVMADVAGVEFAAFGATS